MNEDRDIPPKTPGSLEYNEPHPMARFALEYVQNRLKKYTNLFSLLSHNTIANERTLQVCAETLERIQTGQIVSDRYLLGLAWLIKEIEAK